METEREIAQHYTHGTLEIAILAALRAAGKDPDRLAPADLAPVDEFHIGGRRATIDFAAEFGVRPGMRLLDIGCGLGGASRYFAGEHGCHVTGIDLTPEYVAVAAALAARVGLADRVAYRQGSALALPFESASFDGAYMLHVGMNIADKAALFAGVRRVLKKGGTFGVYDVMRERAGELPFPVPWATRPEISFVESAATYRELLGEAGFEVERTRSRRDFAIEFFRNQTAHATADGGPPPLGLHVLIGPSAKQKFANMLSVTEAGIIAPTELVCRAV